MRLLAISASILLSTIAAAAQLSTDEDSLVASAAAETGTPTQLRGNLARFIDAFIRAYASEEPAWRTDIKLGVASETSTPPDGFQKGRASIGGWYYYRPISCDSLTVEQRRAIMRDKRFAPFVVKMRELADGKLPKLDPAVAAAALAPDSSPQQPVPVGRAGLMAKLAAGRRPPPATISFKVPAGELILPGPIVIAAEAEAEAP